MSEVKVSKAYRVIYMQLHNNYPFSLGKIYEAQRYKAGWLLIDGQLYRDMYFEPMD